MGTAFFINKSNGYSLSEKPFVLTSGHFFAPNNNDIIDDISETSIYVNYEDQYCQEDYVRRGVYAGEFDIVKVGGSFNLVNTDSYIHNEDFALLRSKYNVSQLAVHNVLYAGWDRSFDYNGSSGYAYIGHPMNDVKSVNTYNGTGQVNTQGDFFRIYNSTGICERGFSGSPVFSGNPVLGNEKVVGWAVTTGTGLACGDENQVTRCGMFSELFMNLEIQNKLNPGLKFSQSSWQPTTEALPSHCSNCIQDGDETGLDCGGSCQPCGMFDEFIATTTADLYGRENIDARFNIDINGLGQQIEFSGQNYVLTAGENITLKSFKVTVSGDNKYVAGTYPNMRTGYDQVNAFYKVNVASYASDCECEPIFRGEDNFANLQKSATITGDEEIIVPNGAMLNVFPNPANDYVTVTSNEAIQRLVLISSTGKTIFENAGLNTENHTFTIAHLPVGIYMLKTTTQNGYEEVRKIVKGE